MITDKNYNWLAGKVYDVDANKVTISVRKNTDILNRYVKILKAEDTPDNGMQAMAVVPIKDGKEDRSHIVIAYAGTNSSDIRDIDTDIQSVVFGDDQYLCTH
ncbi:TPA: hypothetical protein SU887_002103, partial [Streptococcus equi subsp. equi]|nr:hypothetical protein [Streptococcus equi subsp. equi]